MKTDAAGNFRINLLIVITDIVSEFCTNILLIRSIKGMFYSLLAMIYDHESTVQIMLVIIVPNQMLNMNTQRSFFFLYSRRSQFL